MVVDFYEMHHFFIMNQFISPLNWRFDAIWVSRYNIWRKMYCTNNCKYSSSKKNKQSNIKKLIKAIISILKRNRVKIKDIVIEIIIFPALISFKDISGFIIANVTLNPYFLTILSWGIVIIKL